MKDKLDKSNVSQILELTTVQRGMLFHFLNEADSNVYNVQISIDIDGNLDVNLLKEAFILVQKQNDALRSVFRWEKLSKPVQIILKDVLIDFTFKDISQENTELEREKLVQEVINDDLGIRFSLKSTPFRIQVIKLSERKHVMVITHHHILYDGWSTGILFDELFSFYRSLSGGHQKLSAKVSYSDVANQLKSELSDKARQFWSQYLEGYKVTSLFSAATNNEKSCEIEKVAITIPNEPLSHYSSTHRVTKASVIYAAYAIFLQKYHDVNDVTFGTTVSNRDNEINGHDQIIGNFINTLPIRIKNAEEKRLNELVKDVSKQLIDRAQYNNTSYFDIKKIHNVKPDRDLFDSVLIIENYPLNTDQIHGNHDLTLGIRSVYENTGIPLVITVFFNDSVDIELSYQTSQFTRDEVNFISTKLAMFIEAIIVGGNRGLKELSLLSENEKNELLIHFNDTQLIYNKQSTIVELFEEQVKATPDQIALVFGEQKLSYNELNGLANGLALDLRNKGVNPNDVVALYTSRSLELFIAQIAVLKSGGSYLPLDPEFPQERLEFMIADAGVSTIICTPDLETTRFKNNTEIDLIVVDSEEISSIGENLDLVNVNDDLAYVIYTSGSTGKPKGVMITHKSVHNYIESLSACVPFNLDTCIISVTTFSFDIFVTESLVPLAKGSTIVIADSDAQKDPHMLSKLITLNDVNLMQTTPSRYRMLANDEAIFKTIGNQLQNILVGGEAFPQDLLKFLQNHTQSQIFNVYGPTETTVWSSLINLTKSDAITIGRPIGNTQFYVLNKDLQLQPKGVVGELYIGGDGLAKGYYNNEELTQKTFIDNPFKQNEKLYKTGDMVRWCPDGLLEYVGRKDFQVKIRGYRIELGEIEGCLLNYSKIKQCAVVVNETDNRKQIVAYYVGDEMENLDELRAYLIKSLPSYMVPAYFISLDSLPMTPNGKLDKARLPLPEIQLRESHKVASNWVEKELLKIWKQLLGHNEISVDQNFFDVGGDSLHLITMSSRIKSIFDADISVTDLFKFTTISQLGKVINKGKEPIDQDKLQEVSSTSDALSKSCDIAIIGMAGRFPEAQDIYQFWENLRAGKESITKKNKKEGDSKIDAKGHLIDYDLFDASFFDYLPSEASKMDPQIRIFHECAWEALEHAGYNPFKYKGKIGLYGGASINPYFNLNLAGSDSDDWVEKWETMTYADKDFLCPRVSYKLNLKGPSVSVNTACSTSLVAVDTACQELISSKCSMALAGGVSISLHDNDGYTHQPGMILSNDGSCRAFDENSSGTVGGNGVGIVVLKRLEDALKDGDSIYAVIKGSATNNDGNEKIGFTAPSVEGQSSAIKQAIRKSNISSESISYVEAHGTGTVLGDPIEIAGLTKAFNTSKRQYCAVGSVKTNIGHLDAAAGIAGLIKATMSLYYKELVPSLHYNNPNPNIDFAHSPFYVSSDLKQWEKSEFPRRAGVSSFGIGGTNAHVILEEPPEVEESSTSREFHLLSFSAKSEESLKNNIFKLSDYLKRNQNISLADVAYTLNKGRAHFPLRVSISAEETSQISEILRELSSDVSMLLSSNRKDEIVFMFSGQGSQYLGMCSDLYTKEEYFKTTVDLCLNIAHELCSKDFGKVLFNKDTEEGNALVNQTEFAQPVLFIIEYALAKLLIRWGIVPSSMIGHSIGEITAACVSGVFTLRDALKLVIKRGEIMQAADPGDMLSISIGQEELMPLVGNAEISIAAINSPSHCVVSGTSEAIENFKDLIEQKEYSCRIIPTSHAFHSYMMDDILESFKASLKDIKFHQPQIPVISNLTGDIADEVLLTNPDYWVRHIRETVHFSSGVMKLMESGKKLFVEVGPGNVLSTFTRSHNDSEGNHTVINLVKHPRKVGDDQQYLLAKVGKIWENGFDINWGAFYGTEKRRRISLPAYSFDRSKFPDRLNQIPQENVRPVRSKNLNDWFYIPGWKSTYFRSEEKKQAGVNIIYGDYNHVYSSIETRLKLESIPFVSVIKGEGYAKISDHQYMVNPDHKDDFLKLFKDLNALNFKFNQILYNGTLDDPDLNNEYNNHHYLFYSLLHFVKVAKKGGILNNIRLVLITNDVYNVLGNETVNIASSAISALANVCAQEYGLTKCHIDLSMKSLDENYDQLVNLITSNCISPTLAVRNGLIWERDFQQIDVKLDASQFKPNGIYLITGGMGKLGYILSEYLIKKYDASVVLIGRTAKQEVADKIARLNSGAKKVIYCQADVTNVKDLENVVCETSNIFGEITGVIHAAGTLNGSSIDIIDNLSDQAYMQQFQTKQGGLHSIHQVFGARNLDFCLAISSISAILGGVRLGAYASANMAMDQYLLSLKKRDWQSLNLDGLSFDDASGEGLNTEELIDVIEAVLTLKNVPQLTVSVGDLDKRISEWLVKDLITLENNDGTDSSFGYNIEDELRKLWKEYFGVEEITSHDDFFELGGDSLKVITMIGRIHKKFKVQLSIGEFFQNSALKDLSDLIVTYSSNNSTIDNIISIAPAKHSYQLSSVQKRLYFLQDFAPNSTAYNMPLALRLKGEIDREKLKIAFIQLIERHEPLRTSFEILDDQPSQIIMMDFDFDIECFDTSDKDVETIISRFIRPFTLKEAPQIRVGLIEKSKYDHIMVVDMPHIITDGISKSVLIQDFMSLYNKEPLEELRIHYKDYAEWQQDSSYKDELIGQGDFWRLEFDDELEPLNIPTDFERPPIKNFEGAIKKFELDETTTLDLKALAEDNDSTLFIILLSCYYIFLGKLSGENDLVIGTPVSGRTSSELERMVGMFINTLPLRNTILSTEKFSDFLARVKNRTIECFDNQIYPFENLLEDLDLDRDLSRNPLFDVFFSYENFERSKLKIPGLEITPFDDNHIVSKFDLTLTAFEENQTLSLHFEYSTKLFNSTTIEKFVDYYKSIIKVVLGDNNIRISDISLITDSEKETILNAFNNTAGVIDETLTISNAFEETVANNGDDVALTYKGRNFTFNDFNSRSNQIAHAILEYQLPYGSRIGILLPRTENLLISIMGVLKAGCAYVPIDPDFPEERVDYIIKDSDVSLMLVDNNEQLIIDKKSIECLNVASEHIKLQKIHNLGIQISSSELAYMIYTSGSTGRPKGVMIEHLNVLNFIEGITSIIDFSARSRFLCLTTVSFDIFVLESILPLIKGYQVILASKDDQKDPDSLCRIIKSTELNVMQITPSHLKMLLSSAEVGEALNSLEIIMVGGESFPVSLLKVLQSYKKLKIYNMYGPTETTVWSSVQELTKAASIDIGFPILNTSMIVIGDDGQLQPIGVPGELYIGGLGVGRGYWGREDLTSEKYVINPAGIKGRFYKTGDLVKWLPNGAIQYLGRIDNQVKIRGYRIELGEIERNLLTYEEISEVVVFAHGPKEDKLLVAYYVSPYLLEAKILKDHLSVQLPNYMIPSYFMHLTDLPLTPNGKIDRKALPKPELTSISEYMAPTSEMEQVVISLWADVLNINIDSIGITDSFFDLGGHSLLASILSNKISKELSLTLPLREVFKLQDVRSQADYLSLREKKKFTSINKSVEKAYYPVSSSQKRLFILNQLDKQSVAYNMPYTVRLKGRLERDKFDQAFSKLVKRHESLRTTFHLKDDEAVQKVEDDHIFKVAYYECEERDVNQKIEKLIAPFDLGVWPLLRAVVYTFRPDSHILVVDMHHIITDGLSQQILLKDFIKIYNQESLPPLQLDYKDYSEWQQSSTQKDKLLIHQDYWKAEFEGEILSLELPYDFARPVARSSNGGRLDAVLDKTLTCELNNLSKREGVSKFILLLCIYYVMLSKLSSQEDIVIGTPVSGREHADLDAVIGLFVNTLPLRNFVNGNKSFKDFVLEVKERFLLSHEHQSYPYEYLIDDLKADRVGNRNPLFDVMFVFQQDNDPDVELSGIQMTPYKCDFKVAKFDLTLIAQETSEGVQISIEYSRDLFLPETIQRFINYYHRIAATVVADVQQTLSDIQIISDNERRELINEFNNTEVPYPKGETIISLFQKQVVDYPNQEAIVYENQRVTFKELDAMVDLIAGLCATQVDGRNKKIALLFNPSIEMIASMLGVMKAGHAYVPLSPDAPVDRNEFILSDSEAQMLLTHEAVGISEIGYPSDQIVMVDQIEKYPYDSEIFQSVSPADLMYVIYTSGTTGYPKGVEVEHGGMVNYIHWRIANFGFTLDDVTMQVVSYHFDGYGSNLYSLLLAGGKTVLLSNENRLNSKMLIKTIEDENVSYIGMTPAIFDVLLSELSVQRAPSLRLVVLAGERASPELIQRSKRVLPKTQISNEYGPTETSVGATCNNHLDENNTSIIGRPMDNTSIYILDNHGELLPIGVYGELCISGVGVARGYLNNKQLTKEKFVNDPFKNGQKMYKTGDLARWKHTGEVEFLGRVDNQVKIRGFRIEPEEIETQLNQYDAITDSVVLAKEISGDKYLVAYYVAEEEIDSSRLRSFLSDELPEYMIPSYYVHILKMPISINGKTDRNGLPSPDLTPREYKAPSTQVEIKLVEIWANVLRRSEDEISVDTSFFELGGHSLKATVLANRVFRDLDVEIPLQEIFVSNTIEIMAEYIENEKWAKSQPSDEIMNDEIILD
ncbi:amino acid adenylation domain-containing protein [Fulvivirga maritima]|uniref:non-ribosomal peptide synthetase/type I polyketide synthase n=1 Tax=Fulvivirga maritima TaxID=2904247 RepID=UPI001F2631E9|nr:non-ribosomal peptide synthetase/type I polyketide synthase [Fulvivirga maritima]UII24647.1 amino acid adenylation domain-containing protein [Fulvivirga maritima]